VDATLDFKQIRYRTIEVKQMGGTARYERGAATLDLDRGTINGAPLTVKLEYDGARLEPRYAWTAGVKDLVVQPVIQALKPEYGDKLTGTAEFASRGSGEGFGDAMLRRLQSESSFTVRDGEMKGIWLLDILASQTKVGALQNMRFFEFGGLVNVAEGKATLQDWAVKGPDARILPSGTVTLADQRVDLTTRVALGPPLAGQVGRNQIAGQLLAEPDGFMRLPFDVRVSGIDPDFKISSGLALGTPGQSTTEAVGETVRGLLGGAIEDRLRKEQEKSGIRPTTGTQTTTGTQPASGTPQPARRPGLGDLLTTSTTRGLLDRIIR
jgi:hypothetical protein